MKKLILVSILTFPIASKAAPETAPGEFIVKKKDGQVSILSFDEKIDDKLGLVKGKSEKDLESLKKQGAIEDFEPNYIYHASWGAKKPAPPPAEPPKPTPPPSCPPCNPAPAPQPTPPPPPAKETPNDPELKRLWGMSKMEMEKAWAKAHGGSPSVVTAIIDTGIDYDHPDLKANVLSKGLNAITNQLDGKDDQGHGTHCAGTIAGVGNNNVGVVGVAYSTKLLPVKFLAKTGGGSTADAIKGIQWAMKEPKVKVMSNSWGGGGYSKSLEQVIAQACAKDIVFVAAAGNENSNNDTTPAYPANYNLPCVISVAATDSTDAFASFSNWGQLVHVAAPGVNIFSTFPGGKYATLSGTSMATPHVSGLVALLRSYKPELSAIQVKELIMGSADKLSSTLWDVVTLASKQVKSGRVNAAKALGGEK